jgi:hypothetical protein
LLVNLTRGTGLVNQGPLASFFFFLRTCVAAFETWPASAVV